MNRLDPIDRKLVAELQRNARVPNGVLAKHAGIAASTCSERVARLRARGVILGFHADVDAEALGIGVQAFLLIELNGAMSATPFEEATSRIPEVIGMYQLSGPYDFQVHVVARDANHLRALALETFPALPGVAGLDTALVFGYRARSLPDLLDDAE